MREVEMLATSLEGWEKWNVLKLGFRGWELADGLYERHKIKQSMTPEIFLLDIWMIGWLHLLRLGRVDYQDLCFVYVKIKIAIKH